MVSSSVQPLAKIFGYSASHIAYQTEMTTPSISSIDPDVPIRNSSEDLFGFAPLVNNVAAHILSYQQSESVVLGVSGSWGSGKTSFLNLLEEAISNQSKDASKKATPTIIRYSPWLISNRSTLLADFLLLLCTKLVKDSSGNIFGLKYLIRLKKQFWDFRKFRKYAIAVSSRERSSDIVSKFVANVGIPLLSDLWRLITKTIKAVMLTPDAINFDDLRNSASNVLEKQNKRIIVLLDDLDRLEPDEIMEILRLVRSTAQLPKITYILCFDKKRVSDTIQSRLGANDHSYTDKISQLYINVPKVDLFDLSELLKKRITRFLRNSNSRMPIDTLLEDKLSELISIITPLDVLKTPRDVVRIFNSFVLEIQTKIDLGYEIESSFMDSVFRAKLPNVDEWIQNYLKIESNDQSSLKDKRFQMGLVSSLQNACSLDSLDFVKLAGIIENIAPNIEWSFE